MYLMLMIIYRQTDLACTKWEDGQIAYTTGATWWHLDFLEVLEDVSPLLEGFFSLN